MHVAAQSHLSPEQLNERFRSETLRSTCHVDYQSERQPPKFFLQGAVPTPAPAAEVHVEATDAGSNIVLRLMWGPLPAPFPRALAVICLLAAIAMPAVIGITVASISVAAVLGGLPLAALAYQKVGERRLTNRLSEISSATAFAAVPH